MPAAIQINEYNTSGETKTANIANTNMGSSDEANLDPVAHPIDPGDNTFEKYQTFEVTSMGGSSLIDKIKVWRDGALGGDAEHKTNAKETAYSPAGFATPTENESSVAVEEMPEASPDNPNLGIGGDLDGGFESAGESDLLVHQIQSNESDTAGSTSTLKFSYREVA